MAVYTPKHPIFYMGKNPNWSSMAKLDAFIKQYYLELYDNEVRPELIHKHAVEEFMLYNQHIGTSFIELYFERIKRNLPRTKRDLYSHHGCDYVEGSMWIEIYGIISWLSDTQMYEDKGINQPMEILVDVHTDKLMSWLVGHHIAKSFIPPTDYVNQADAAQQVRWYNPQGRRFQPYSNKLKFKH